MNRKPGKTEIPTPPKLVPAVIHVTRNFHEADRLYGQLTSFFCRSELHPIPIDDHFAISLQNFRKLKQSIGAEASELLLETIAQKTAPAFIKGYFIFYLSCAIAHARDSYKELINVARANAKSLDEKPSAWVIACMRQMITDSRFYAESWLQCVCDNRTYRPAAVNNDVQLEKSWRPPTLCVMSPFGFLPFKEKIAWDRNSEKVGTLVQTFVADKYEEHVLYHVERLAATEEFKALKIGDLITMPPVGISSVDASNEPLSPKVHIGREARRNQTQAMYRAWQGEYRKLKKKHQKMSEDRKSVV